MSRSMTINEVFIQPLSRLAARLIQRLRRPRPSRRPHGFWQVEMWQTLGPMLGGKVAADEPRDASVETEQTSTTN